ncbi:ESX-1 secretion-associated protein EspB-like [Anopheles stephensi]|uniref:ESX-1 secretion-associated protein EspB-like n=1 Tax=Anopheles stephensi TaxID=30069 RepID=UPI001658727D|nr:ESX-1 secretion-associated protein EspB-like [Anopheles stephensi]
MRTVAGESNLNSLSRSVDGRPSEAKQPSVDTSELDARAGGPFDIRPTLPTTSTSASPTSAEPGPLGGLLGGGGGLPELGSGAQQSGGSASPQASLIIGAFQAIITPFNPGMLGPVLGGLGGGGGGGGGGGAPSLPSFPIGAKPQK